MDPEEQIVKLGVQRRYRGLSKEELDIAYAAGVSMEEAEKAERLREYENSPEQRDWEADEEEDPDTWGDGLNWYER